jgi:hypothetical protein
MLITLFLPGYPPADGQIRNCISTNDGTETRSRLRSRYHLFLIALFTHIYNIIRKWPAETNKIAFASKWRQYLNEDGKRKEIYNDVVQIYTIVSQLCSRRAHLLQLFSSQRTKTPYLISGVSLSTVFLTTITSDIPFVDGCRHD